MNTCKVSNGLQLVIMLPISWAWLALVPMDKQRVTILYTFKGSIINVISSQCYILGNVVPLTNEFHALVILFKITPTEKKTRLNYFTSQERVN